MLGWKIRTLSLALLLVSLLCLATAQPSSIHELDADVDASMFERAKQTGKKVGAKCKTSTACHSQYCESGTNPCINNLCTLPPLLAPGQPCSNATQCASNSCSASNPCVDDSGAGRDCGGDYYNPQAICGQFDVGHTCANAGQCTSGICKSGVCSAHSAVGDTCPGGQYQCTDGQTCVEGTCTLFADDSRYPFDRCSTDAQCKTKECGYHWNLYTPTGPWYWLYGHNVYDPICRPYFDGEQGCRTDIDCIGLCKNGNCELVPNGEHCIFTQQCQAQNLCGLDGICYTPDTLTNRAPGQPCRGETSDECSSGYCGPQTFERPNLDGTGNVTVYDPVCAGGYSGGGNYGYGK